VDYLWTWLSRAWPRRSAFGAVTAADGAPGTVGTLVAASGGSDSGEPEADQTGESSRAEQPAGELPRAPAENRQRDAAATMSEVMARYGYDAAAEDEPPEWPRAEDTPIGRLAATILRQAVRERASHVHLEPDRRGMRVRFRTDGVLHEAFQMPKFVQGPLIRRFAVLADFDLASHRGRPQTGGFDFQIDDARFDVRAAATPTIFGDRLTLRVASAAAAMPGLNALGFTPEVQAGLEALCQLEAGLLLFAGPQGSGRSTTQYALLNKLNSVERYILTIEPWSSFQLADVTQVELARRRGASLTDVWRTAQDVDVVHIDRVCDAETAEIAVGAAEAGALVLAGIDARDAVGGLLRLMDYGITAHRAAQSVLGVLAQTLVRRICKACRDQYEVPATAMRRFGFRPQNPEQTVTLSRGLGCEQCRHTGYHDQLGVCELLRMNAEIACFLGQGGSIARIADAAKANGMHALQEDGLVKVLEGHTTPNEIVRALSL